MPRLFFEELPPRALNQLVESLGHFISNTQTCIPNRLFQWEAFIAQFEEFAFEVFGRINQGNPVQKLHEFAAGYVNLQGELFVCSADFASCFLWDVGLDG